MRWRRRSLSRRRRSQSTTEMEFKMTNQELRESADRLLDTPIGGDIAGYDASPRRVRDMRMVALAWVNEHPADDAEPIDMPWLLAIGGKDEAQDTDRFVSVRHQKSWWYENKSDGFWCLQINNGIVRDASDGRPKPTRGEYRQLCRIIGIPLVEGTPPA